MIITPPAKEKKSEHQDSAVKTEKDWLSLPKNIPKENISLSDPNIYPRLIHKENETSTTAMTVNTEKTNNHENLRSIDVTNESEPNVTTEKTNDHESSRSIDFTSESEPNVTTEKAEDSMTTRGTYTQDKETSVNHQTSSNQQAKTNPNEDWASLMLHSDDSLFNEMTKQLENNKDRSEPNTK